MPAFHPPFPPLLLPPFVVQSAQRLRDERDELQNRLDQSSLERTMGAALAETQVGAAHGAQAAAPVGARLRAPARLCLICDCGASSS